MPKKTADKPAARSGKRDVEKEAPAAPVVGDSANTRGPRNPRRGPRGANEGGMKDIETA
jgi:hypothetical protein